MTRMVTQIRKWQQRRARRSNEEGDISVRFLDGSTYIRSIRNSYIKNQFTPVICVCCFLNKQLSCRMAGNNCGESGVAWWWYLHDIRFELKITERESLVGGISMIFCSNKISWRENNAVFELKNRGERIIA